jgi:stearoyl-CoA desaturase (delta-9 desaturase)
VLRHRLHHRYTDTDSDPYSANKGLLWSHVGWIFVKEEYPALRLVDKGDLDSDPVVRFQHRWFILLALSGGLLVPALLGKYWIGNWQEGILWGGFVSRIAIWHCTYFPSSGRIPYLVF